MTETPQGIGHNGGPPIAVRNFRRKWAESILSHPDKPMGAVAMAFKLYMEMGADGTGAVVSDRAFSEACNVSERACQNFKKWLVQHGFVTIAVKGNKGRANTFTATIPQLTAQHAANPDQLPAPIAGNNQHHRHVLPETETGSPARIAGNVGLTAPDAGNQPPAKESFPHTPFKEINKLPSQSDRLDNTSPREADGHPEIAGLNGATSLIVGSFAEWMNPHVPDIAGARKSISEAVRIYGDRAVRDGFAELSADIADGKLRIPTVKSFYGYCRTAKEREGRVTRQGGPTQRSASDEMRSIEAIVGKEKFAEIMRGRQ